MIFRAVTSALLLPFLLATGASAQPSLNPPAEKGLPILVKVGVAFVEVSSFNENTGAYTATVDVRLRWEDPRLRKSGEGSGAPQVFRGEAAQTKLKTLWVPQADIVNQRTKPTYTAAGISLYPDGRVELIKRTTGEFTTSFEVTRFPFDRQKLKLEVATRTETANVVRLVFEQQDLDFSKVAAGASLDGWEFGIVNLRDEPLAGWNSTLHSRAIAALEIKRTPGAILAAIGIPLFASLLIPLLAIWLNRIDDGQFQIETFELVNIIIGGLFAVIALNFTVNSLYQVLGSGDNPISRLFALNYGTLGVSLIVNILLFRFGVIERMFGRYVQEQLYLCLMWAIPTLVFTTACAIVLVAVV
jgi:hypothetical protein